MQSFGAVLEHVLCALEVLALVVVGVLEFIHLHIDEPGLKRQHEIDPGIMTLCSIEPHHDFMPEF